MRNTEFVPLIVDLVREAHGVVSVQTLAEAGDTAHPLGFVVTTVRSGTRWQALHQLADGESHDHPAPDIEGEPAVWTDEALTADGWLTAVIGRAQMPQIARIVCWSQRPDSGDDQGVTVYFHNGARSFFRRI